MNFKKIEMTKNILIGLCCSLVFTSFAQKKEEAPNKAPLNWYLKDPSDKGIYGVGAERAYELLNAAGKKPKQVIVAVIDSGVETDHPDLKDVIWVNEDEIPANGIDDDKNGYIDDVHGWNFLGGKNGQSVKRAPDERSRIYHKYKAKFLTPLLDTNTLSASDKVIYATWKKTENELNYSDEEKDQLKYVEMLASAFKKHDKVLKQEMNVVSYNRETLTTYIPTSIIGKEAKLGLLSLHRLMQLDEGELNTYTISQMEEYIDIKHKRFHYLPVLEDYAVGYVLEKEGIGREKPIG